MKSNRELRQEAKAAVRGKWFWRIVLVFFALQTVAQIAVGSLAHFNRERGITSLGELWVKKLSAMQQGLDYTLPTHDAYAQMWVATGFEYFVGTVAGAILLFGLTAVTLRAIANKEEDWLSSGFGGFRCPLGVTALLFVQNLIIGFWALFFIVPGIIAGYRYRAVWYLKCENPDWGVMQCLGESSKMMKGYKCRAFLFDLYYYVQLFAIALLGCAGAAVMSSGGILAAIGWLILAFVVVVVFYTMVQFVAGRTAFYRELKSQLGESSSREARPAPPPPPTESKDDLPGND